jgi:uncharacterized protein RhaS with RHS repeats
MEYDAAGRMVKQTTPDEKVTGYAVNAPGEVISVTNPLHNKTSHGP